MNEVTKLYRNAGVGKQKYYACQNCKYEDVFEEKLPPFTAEKQIELIKWLAELTDFASFSPDVSVDENTKVKIYGFAFVMRGERHYYVDDKFEIALAKCFNNLWQDLTEEERKQIKNILESEVRE